MLPKVQPGKRACARPGCAKLFVDRGSGSGVPRAYCSTECHHLHREPTKAAAPPRVELRRTEGAGQRRPRSISSASTAQREVVRVTSCIVTGRVKASGYAIDPAHLWPRGKGGCDSDLCVVPLWRPVHRAYDDGRFDLLPYVVAHGLHAQMAHAMEHAGGDVVALINQVTSCRFEPVTGDHLVTVEELEERWAA